MDFEFLSMSLLHRQLQTHFYSDAIDSIYLVKKFWDHCPYELLPSHEYPNQDFDYFYLVKYFLHPQLLTFQNLALENPPYFYNHYLDRKYELLIVVGHIYPSNYH